MHEGGLRYHWMRWKELCLPQDGGGVGFRDMEHVYVAFSMKLWWQFRQGDSFWTRFMAAKYCPQAYPCMVDVFRGDSHIWRRMLATQKQAKPNMISLLGYGVSNFWFKNWLGSGPLCQRLENLLNHQVQDFVSSGQWNQQLLLQWVPSPVVAKILRKDPPSSYQSDRIIWKTSQSGVFLLLQVSKSYDLLPHPLLFSRKYGIPICLSRSLFSCYAF